MVLAIDVGNTNIVFGVFDGAKLVQSWRLLTLRERTADEVGLLVTGLFAHEKIALTAIKAIVMGSVVPVLTPIMRTARPDSSRMTWPFPAIQCKLPSGLRLRNSMS